MDYQTRRDKLEKLRQKRQEQARQGKIGSKARLVARFLGGFYFSGCFYEAGEAVFNENGMKIRNLFSKSRHESPSEGILYGSQGGVAIEVGEVMVYNEDSMNLVSTYKPGAWEKGLEQLLKQAEDKRGELQKILIKKKEDIIRRNLRQLESNFTPAN